MKRSGSSIPQFVQRIPADIKDRAVGLKLALPLGDDGPHNVTISAKAKDLRFSLRTRDPAIAKIRQASAVAYLETVWKSLRAKAPVTFTHRQAVALAGDLYRAWAEGAPGERTIAILQTPQGWVRDDSPLNEEEEAAAFEALSEQTEAARAAGEEAADLERILGPIVSRLLLARGIAEVDAASRTMLLVAFAGALRDAFKSRAKNAAGDYSPDPNAVRFPAFKAPESKLAPALPASAVSLTQLVEDWWTEAKAAGRKPSTYESYRNSMRRFVAHVGHDDAARIAPEHVVGFKDARLKEVSKRGKLVSAQTVHANDLAGLKTVFGWAVTNLKMASNPAAGIGVKVGKRRKLRPSGFTDAEATALLRAASAIQPPPGRRQPTEYAKRWVPWLLCYTGARVGEMAQLRKQDLRREGNHWVVTITPEAGTTKTDEARDVVLHEHLVAQGFPGFVEASPAGPLFLRPAKDGTVLGPLRGLKNRLAEFARETVKDPNVQPSHAWRHRFKTVGMEAGIAPRILDAIQGHAPSSAGDDYGDVTVKTMAMAIAKLPRVEISDKADKDD